MPFCTQCGHSNTDDARFCSNCGAALKPATAGRLAERDVDDHHRRRRSSRASPSEKAEGLSTADQAAVDALPPGSALLVVRRGPNAGSRFLLDSDTTTAGRHPSSDIFLDDVTVSRRHAEFVRDGGRLHASATSAASTAPTSTGSASTRPRSPAATRCRSASTAWCSTPSQHGAEPGDERGPVPPVADEHRGGAGAAAPGVPRRHDLQDPVPRVGGAGRAGAHAVGLPQVLPRRRRPAALRAGGPARPLPAAAGHQGAPRRHRPRARAAGRAGGSGRGSPSSAGRPDWLPGPRALGETTELRLSRDELRRVGRHRRRRCSTELEGYGLVAGARQHGGDGTTTPTRWSIATDGRRDGRLRPRAPAPAAVPDRRRPRGRTWSSRSSRRCCASATRRRGPAPRRSPASWPRCRVRLHTALVRARLRDVVGR